MRELGECQQHDHTLWPRDQLTDEGVVALDEVNIRLIDDGRHMIRNSAARRMLRLSRNRPSLPRRGVGIADVHDARLAEETRVYRAQIRGQMFYRRAPGFRVAPLCERTRSTRRRWARPATIRPC